MFPHNHGAVSCFRISSLRIIMTPSSSLKLSSSSIAATMGPTFSKLRGGRALSQMAQPRRAALPVQRTWHPSAGIVFSPPNTSTTPGTPRSLATAATAEVQPHDEFLLAHSSAEDNYVMAATTDSAGSPTTEPDPELPPELVAPDETLYKTLDPLPQSPEHDSLPKTPTKFAMTEELFRAAKEARIGTSESFWSHRLYRGPPTKDGVSKKPTVHYCRSKATMDKVLKQHFSCSKVIGFDLEWKPDAFRSKNPRHCVSLIQIANEERIALFHLALFPRPSNGKEDDLVSPRLKAFLEDPGIMKCGVSIKSDCTRVRKYLNINPKGLFELSHLFKLIKFSESKDYHLIDRRLVSLAKQVYWHLHLPLYKSNEVRSSDWSQQLNLDQIMYAASDSYAGLQLYMTMDMKRKELDPTPPLPWHAELNLPIRVAEGVEIATDTEEGDEEVRAEDGVVGKDGGVVEKEVAAVENEGREEEGAEVDVVKSSALQTALKKLGFTVATEANLYPTLPPLSDDESEHKQAVRR